MHVDIFSHICKIYNFKLFSFKRILRQTLKSDTADCRPVGVRRSLRLKYINNVCTYITYVNLFEFLITYRHIKPTLISSVTIILSRF